MHVADPVSAADHGLRIDAVCRPDAWREVFVIGIHQRAIIKAAARCPQYRISRRVEIRQYTVPLPARRREFPTQSEIQREFRVHPEIILGIKAVHALPVAPDQVVRQLNLAGKTEHEIRQVVAGRVICNRTACRLTQLRASGFAELAGIGVEAIDRIDIHYLGMDNLQFSPHLESVPAQDFRVVHFRTPSGRVLKLRIGRLPPKSVEPADALRIQAAGEIRGGG